MARIADTERSREIKTIRRVLDWLIFAFALAVGGAWVFILANPSRYLANDPSIGNVMAFFVGPPVVLVVLVGVIRLGRPRRTNVQFAIVSALIVLFSVEGVLSVDLSVPEQSVREAVSKMRQQGSNVFHVLDRGELSQIKLDPSGLFPIAQLPDADIVHCNAGGVPSVFRSDRYGFRNPPDGVSLPFRAVAVGDSFTMGSCIDDGETFVDLLRNQLGPVLSIAAPGNGPLSNLAGYREFVEADPDLRFEYLIWFHYQNDFGDLDWEVSTHLLRYAEPGFSQGLRSKLDVLRREMSARLERPDGGVGELRHLVRQRGPLGGVVDFAKATEVRRYLGMLGRGGEWTPLDLDLFERILRSARDDANQRNAKMVFVYIPSYDDIRWPGNNKEYGRLESVKVARSLGLEVLDLTEMLRNRGNPFDIFPNGRAVHYNATGHQLIATSVIDLLETLER